VDLGSYSGCSVSKSEQERVSVRGGLVGAGQGWSGLVRAGQGWSVLVRAGQGWSGLVRADRLTCMMLVMCCFLSSDLIARHSKFPSAPVIMWGGSGEGSGEIALILQALRYERRVGREGMGVEVMEEMMVKSSLMVALSGLWRDASERVEMESAGEGKSIRTVSSHAVSESICGVVLERLEGILGVIQICEQVGSGGGRIAAIAALTRAELGCLSLLGQK